MKQCRLPMVVLCAAVASLVLSPVHAAVQWYCPLFPLYQEGSDWVYYCDGVDDDCLLEEASIVVGEYTAPYEFCTAQCISAGSTVTPQPASLSGFPAQFVERGEIRLVNEKAREKFPKLAERPVGVPQFVKILDVNPSMAGDQTVVFRITAFEVPQEIAKKRGMAYRLVGHEVNRNANKVPVEVSSPAAIDGTTKMIWKGHIDRANKIPNKLPLILVRED